MEVGAIPGMTCYGTWGQREEPCYFCHGMKALDSQEAQHLEVEYGGILWDAHWIPVSQDMYLHYAFDITEKRRMENEITKSEKLDSVGTLAGGIAHDFNNLLTGIMGNVGVVKLQKYLNHKSFEMLEETEKAIFRAKDLTSQLLTFSKGGSPVKQTASLGEIIRESAKFVLSGSNVKYEFNIPDDLWSVDVDVGQFNQVINNILINAKQAILEYGIITVTCQNVPYGEESFQNLNAFNYKGNFVRMSITDTGAGIPEEHLDKIFDPYFTTKEKGIGLGLASAYSIVDSHGGMIMVESTPGEGTTFQICIPASDKVPEKHGISDEILKGSGRILLMDDEEIVRESVSSMLEGLGYEVDMAVDGAEAIEKYKEAKDSGISYDAVIMDLTVPGGMGGKEAIVKHKEIDPEVKAIVSSGYSQDPVMAHYEDYGFCGVLSKPYRLEELSRVIHDLLEG